MNAFQPPARADVNFQMRLSRNHVFSAGYHDNSRTAWPIDLKSIAECSTHPWLWPELELWQSVTPFLFYTVKTAKKKAFFRFFFSKRSKKFKFEYFQIILVPAIAKDLPIKMLTDLSISDNPVDRNRDSQQTMSFWSTYLQHASTQQPFSINPQQVDVDIH